MDEVARRHVADRVRAAAETVGVVVPVEKEQKVVGAVVIEVRDVSGPGVVAARGIIGHAARHGLGRRLALQPVDGTADADIGRVGNEDISGRRHEHADRVLEIGDLAADDPRQPRTVEEQKQFLRRRKGQQREPERHLPAVGRVRGRVQPESDLDVRRAAVLIGEEVKALALFVGIHAGQLRREAVDAGIDPQHPGDIEQRLFPGRQRPVPADPQNEAVFHLFRPPFPRKREPLRMIEPIVLCYGLLHRHSLSAASARRYLSMAGSSVWLLS